MVGESDSSASPSPRVNDHCHISRCASTAISRNSVSTYDSFAVVTVTHGCLARISCSKRTRSVMEANLPEALVSQAEPGRPRPELPEKFRPNFGPRTGRLSFERNGVDDPSG